MQLKTKKIVQVNDKLIALKNDTGEIEIYEKKEVISTNENSEIEEIKKQLKELK